MKHLNGNRGYGEEQERDADERILLENVPEDADGHASQEPSDDVRQRVEGGLIQSLHSKLEQKRRLPEQEEVADHPGEEHAGAEFRHSGNLESLVEFNGSLRVQPRRKFAICGVNFLVLLF
ncbi:hypothetical protein AVEN_195315-1 [Araneus ventricosus]|uniref:Uncharacterized protein n=1 Tax=Araneus ventricosus TaxID=182803 RepID=A0A4Y2ICJ1_ARAVE|nr:hypothetical protein AVEN_195315-1 [Araneus ventricosus]